MIPIVTTGRPCAAAPVVMPRDERVGNVGFVFRSAATQSTHWNPTDAGIWQRGHAGRPQR